MELEFKIHVKGELLWHRCAGIVISNCEYTGAAYADLRILTYIARKCEHIVQCGRNLNTLNLQWPHIFVWQIVGYRDILQAQE